MNNNQYTFNGMKNFYGITCYANSIFYILALIRPIQLYIEYISTKYNDSENHNHIKSLNNIIKYIINKNPNYTDDLMRYDVSTVIKGTICKTDPDNWKMQQDSHEFIQIIFNTLEEINNDDDDKTLYNKYILNKFFCSNKITVSCYNNLDNPIITYKTIPDQLQLFITLISGEINDNPPSTFIDLLRIENIHEDYLDTCIENYNEIIDYIGKINNMEDIKRYLFLNEQADIAEIKKKIIGIKNLLVVRYPNNHYIKELNNMIKELDKKLESHANKNDFHILKGYISKIIMIEHTQNKERNNYARIITERYNFKDFIFFQYKLEQSMDPSSITEFTDPQTIICDHFNIEDNKYILSYYSHRSYNQALTGHYITRAYINGTYYMFDDKNIVPIDKPDFDDWKKYARIAVYIKESSLRSNFSLSNLNCIRYT